MAFSACTVIAGFAGSSFRRESSQAILGKIAWVEEPATSTATTNTAPAPSDGAGQPMFRIRVTADSWVSIGKTPVLAAGTRIPVPANTDYDVFVDTGDKLAWVAA